MRVWGVMKASAGVYVLLALKYVSARRSPVAPLVRGPRGWGRRSKLLLGPPALNYHTSRLRFAFPCLTCLSVWLFAPSHLPSLWRPPRQRNYITISHGAHSVVLFPDCKGRYYCTKAEVPKRFEHHSHWENIAILPKNTTHFGKNP